MNYKVALCGILNKEYLPEMFNGFYSIMRNYAIKNSESISKKIKSLEQSHINNTEQRCRIYNMGELIHYDDVDKRFDKLIKLLN